MSCSSTRSTDPGRTPCWRSSITGVGAAPWFEIFQGSFAGTGCASGRIRCYAIDSGIATVPKRYGLALSAAGYPAAEAISWSVTGYDAYLILLASTATMLAVPDQSVRLADVWSSIAHKLGSTSPTGSAGRYSFDANGDSLLNAFVVFRKTAKSWVIV